MKIHFMLLLSVLLLFMGCASKSEENIINSTEVGGEVSSYAALLRINGAEYQSVGENSKGKYTLKEEIGIVKKRVPPEVLPREDFASNYLDEGTQIYSVKETSDVIIVLTEEEGVYEIFEKSHVNK